jgi:dodecin
MSEHVYKTIELVGSSTTGVEDAVQRAIGKAAETVRNLRWFEVLDTRGHIEQGRVAHWQVTLKLGFTLEDGWPSAGSKVTAPRFQIRRATPSDAPELARLRYAFRTELDPSVESESAFIERCTAWMAEHLGRGNVWLCWVAVVGTTLVGTVWLQLIEKLPNPVGHPGRHGYMSSVYIVPELRNAGIGSALLDACLAETQALGVDAVFLWPTSRSRTFYARHGFGVREDLLERRQSGSV